MRTTKKDIIALLEDYEDDDVVSFIDEATQEDRIINCVRFGKLLEHGNGGYTKSTNVAEFRLVSVDGWLSWGQLGK